VEEDLLFRRTFATPAGMNAPMDITLYLQQICDHGEFFELQPQRARNMITAFGRIGGHVVGFVSNNSAVASGQIDVDAARNGLEAKLRDSGLVADPPRAVSAISGDGLEGLSEAMILALPEETRLEAARALTRAREARVRIGNEVVQACTAVSVTVGLTPIPFSDMVLLGPLQAMMVSSLAYLSGRTWGKKTVAEWLGSLGVVGGLGMGLRFSAQTIAKLVPGAGNVVSAGVAGAGTTAIGQSAIKYFLKS